MAGDLWNVGLHQTLVYIQHRLLRNGINHIWSQTLYRLIEHSWDLAVNSFTRWRQISQEFYYLCLYQI